MLQAMNQKGQKGFTLVELMIVVAIIGILAAIAIPQFAQYRIRGFNASAQSDLRNLTTAQEAFFADWQAYAVTREVVVTPGATAGDPPTITGELGTASPDGVVLAGPSSVGTVIAQHAQGAHRQLQIGLGNAVSAIAETDPNFVSYVAVAKHVQGNTIYGSDSDSSAMYRDQQRLGPGQGMGTGDDALKIMDLGTTVIPDSSPQVDNFDADPSTAAAWAAM